MTSILHRQVDAAEDGDGLLDDAEVGSVIDVGAKGTPATKTHKLALLNSQ